MSIGAEQQRPTTATTTKDADQKAKDAVVLRQAIENTEQGVRLRSLDDMYRFAQYVHASHLAPESLDSVEKIVIAIELGAELGLRPMQALQTIAVIGNRPTVWGDGLKAIVEASPLCEGIVERFEGSPYNDDFTAICICKRRGRADPVVSRYSVADAKLAKLWQKKSKQGYDTPWVTNPKRMLQMRARAFGLRDCWPDVTRGIRTAEETVDMEVEPTSEWLPEPATTRSEAVAEKLRKPKAAPAPEGVPADLSLETLRARFAACQKLSEVLSIVNSVKREHADPPLTAEEWEAIDQLAATANERLGG